MVVVMVMVVVVTVVVVIVVTICSNNRNRSRSWRSWSSKGSRRSRDGSCRCCSCGRSGNGSGKSSGDGITGRHRSPEASLAKERMFLAVTLKPPVILVAITWITALADALQTRHHTHAIPCKLCMTSMSRIILGQAPSALSDPRKSLPQFKKCCSSASGSQASAVDLPPWPSTGLSAHSPYLPLPPSLPPSLRLTFSSAPPYRSN